jgi:hypothetical protein
MASPHAAGTAALLWAAKPQLRGLIGITRCLIAKSARNIVKLTTEQVCGGTGPGVRPNNLWGYGLIDAYDAIHLPDGDLDGIGNLCDCAPADPGVYDSPGEAKELRFAGDKATLSWGSLSHPAGAGTLYDVISGSLADLRSSGSVAAASCLGLSSTTPERFDVTVPAAGTGLYYLVQARNTCGSGGFGTASNLTPRLHDSCP